MISMNTNDLEATLQSIPAKLPKMTTSLPSSSQDQRKRGRKSGKIFPCNYDDCTRVFTRSEHLERHFRKHTGEKPYSCIVPNCPRTFSRFDNMLQHTTTHHRNRKQSISAPAPINDPLPPPPLPPPPPPTIAERRAQPPIKLDPFDTEPRFGWDRFMEMGAHTAPIKIRKDTEIYSYSPCFSSVLFARRKVHSQHPFVSPIFSQYSPQYPFPPSHSPDERPFHVSQLLSLPPTQRHLPFPEIRDD
ncbi:uncharacterized protein VTP21DRAFT_11193 [Calcarisporiella thermophila]|uniref:uncharacterized protein n=1 Tax=Calcarisporiella thermophila TaxID=911321 RepID=UPI0037441F2A